MELNKHLAQLFSSSSPWSPEPSKGEVGSEWDRAGLSFYLLFILEFCRKFNWGKNLTAHCKKPEDCLSPLVPSYVWV